MQMQNPVFSRNVLQVQVDIFIWRIDKGTIDYDYG